MACVGCLDCLPPEEEPPDDTEWVFGVCLWFVAAGPSLTGSGAPTIAGAETVSWLGFKPFKSAEPSEVGVVVPDGMALRVVSCASDGAMPAPAPPVASVDCDGVKLPNRVLVEAC